MDTDTRQMGEAAVTRSVIKTTRLKSVLIRVPPWLMTSSPGSVAQARTGPR